MEFCKKCGSVLIQKKVNSVCPRCKYSTKIKGKLTTSEKIEEKNDINVVSEKDSEIHPIINEDCKKCKHKKSYFWTMQTRASDESETKFFKCVKCKHTWREYK